MFFHFQSCLNGNTLVHELYILSLWIFVGIQKEVGKWPVISCNLCYTLNQYMWCQHRATNSVDFMLSSFLIPQRRCYTCVLNLWHLPSIVAHLTVLLLSSKWCFESLCERVSKYMATDWNLVMTVFERVSKYMAAYWRLVLTDRVSKCLGTDWNLVLNDRVNKCMAADWSLVLTVW